MGLEGIEMRTRDKSFRDYGIDPDEEKQLKRLCKSAEFSYHDILLQAAVSSNPVIAPDLYYSLASGVSYEKINNVKRICLAKNDFYGYQRKCLSIFKNLLIVLGKWE